MDLVTQVIFSSIVILCGSLACAICALIYFQRVHMERPAVGVFNFRDILVVLFFVGTLPLLYLIFPSIVLTSLLVITFSSAMYMALRPLMPRRYIWTIITVLIAGNIVVTETLLGTRTGWQLYWILINIVVLIAVVGVSNLYVQGGMRLQHVAWFALALAFYDGLFAWVIPITLKLADRFEGQPLDPSIGFVMGTYNGNIGLGDLLVYGLFTVAAFKGFGKRGTITAFVIIPIFGAILPGIAPLFISLVIRNNIGVVVPAQVFFGPIAFLAYFWLARQAPERNMAEWLKVQTTSDRAAIETLRRTRTATQPNVGSSN